MELKKIVVGLDEGSYFAYSSGFLWNGFECPYFTKEEVEEMSIEFNKEMQFWYDEETDSYNALFEGEEEAEVFEGKIIDYNGRELKLYPIGSGSWTWMQV